MSRESSANTMEAAIPSAASPGRIVEMPPSVAGAQHPAPAKPITLCHFSTAHRDLKSRTFHRQCLPLAEGGFQVKYVSPAGIFGLRDGVDFCPVPWRKSRWLRFLSAPTLLRKLLRQSAHVYHFQDPELLPVAFLLKWVFRKKVVYDAYEDFPSMALSAGSLPKAFRPIAGRVMKAAEYLAAHSFDGVIAADALTLRRLAQAGKSRKLVFYNFPHLDFFPSPVPAPKMFDIVYRGGLSERAGTFVLLEALRLLAEQGRRPRLLLIGYFDSKRAESDLLDRIHSLGLESSVVLEGRLGHERMAAALSRARIGVSPLQDTAKFRLNIPVKIFEYWACGLPVIASDLPPIRPFFRHSLAGLLFQPEDAAALAHSIGWLLDHPEAAIRMGRRGRAAIEQRLNNSFEARKLAAFCRRIAAAT